MVELELVAVGARTPVGLTAQTSAAAVRAGVSRLGEFPFATVSGAPLVLGHDPCLDPLAEGRDRMWPMLEAALEQALDSAGSVLGRRGAACDVLLSLPECRPGFSEADAQWLTRATHGSVARRGIISRVAVVGRGHAGALYAIHQAIQQVVAGAPMVLVAGVDSYHHPETLLWLEAEQRLALEGIPSGFTPGEAAGCLLLTTKAVRCSCRLPRLAVLVGAGVAQESRLRSSETGSFGVALQHAVAQAGHGLSFPAEAADTVYCDINGERYRSEEWGFFATRGSHMLRSLEYHAPSDLWGDVGAAFGPLAVTLATQSFARGYAAGPRALIMAGSESGLRGAIFLRSP